MLHMVYGGYHTDGGELFTRSYAWAIISSYDLAAKWEWEDTEGSVQLFVFLSGILFLFVFLFQFFNFELIFPAASSEMSRT